MVIEFDAIHVGIVALGRRGTPEKITGVSMVFRGERSMLISNRRLVDHACVRV